MQEIFSPIRDLGMNRSGSISMPGALRAGQDRFQVAVTALGLDRRQSLITERGKSPQPQIDSQTRDRPIEDRTDGRFISLLQPGARHTDIQIPASAAVFTEITGTQFEVAETTAIPQRQPTSREVDLSPSIANRSDLKGNPAQGAAGTAWTGRCKAQSPRVTPLRNGQKSNPDRNRRSRSNTLTDRSLQ